MARLNDPFRMPARARIELSLRSLRSPGTLLGSNESLTPPVSGGALGRAPGGAPYDRPNAVPLKPILMKCRICRLSKPHSHQPSLRT
jgi:hypothetical protein